MKVLVKVQYKDQIWFIVEEVEMGSTHVRTQTAQPRAGRDNSRPPRQHPAKDNSLR